MPTAAEMRTQLRQALDDFETPRRRGLMWSDAELDRALTAAQYATVRALYKKRHWHLISRLGVTVNGASPLALPANYMFYGSAQCESISSGDLYPASLHIGFAARNYSPDAARFTATITSAAVEFYHGELETDGEFRYWRRPTIIAGGSNHTEFIDQVYEMIVHWATALLQVKDWGQCQRAIKNLAEVYKRITSTPYGMNPVGLMEVAGP